MSSVAEQWNWEGMIFWARRFYEWSALTVHYREFNIRVGASLAKVREALFADTTGVSVDWIDTLEQASARGNRLTDGTHRNFVKWCRKEPGKARAELLALWDESVPLDMRLDRWDQGAPDDAVRQMQGMFASFLLLAVDPTRYAMYKDGIYRCAYKLAGYKERPSRGAGAGPVYLHALAFLDEFLDQAGARGLDLRDRLNVQAIIWCMLKPVGSATPVRTWTTDEKDSFIAWCKGRQSEDTETISFVSQEDESSPLSDAEQVAGAGQGFRNDPAMNDEIDQYAMSRVMRYFTQSGWRADDVSKAESYDVRCVRGDRELHIEVKGTTMAGSKVLLTRNEVSHARRQAPNVVLCVVANIHIERDEAGGYVASGGEMLVIDPWDIDEGELIPMTFEYRLPVARRMKV